MMKFFGNKNLFILLLPLLISSCVSAESQISRIRVLEKRVIRLEIQEKQNQQIENLSNQLKRSLLLLSQQIDDLNIDREKNVKDLEIIKQNLKKWEIELGLLKLQLQKIKKK